MQNAKVESLNVMLHHGSWASPNRNGYFPEMK